MKTKVLVDVKLECEAPNYVGRYERTPERIARAIEDWIKEFTGFLRDHRSQDMIGLSVERIYEYRCSYCESEWEEDENGCPVCCDTAIEEWEHRNDAKDVSA